MKKKILWIIALLFVIGMLLPHHPHGPASNSPYENSPTRCEDIWDNMHRGWMDADGHSKFLDFCAYRIVNDNASDTEIANNP